MSTERRQQVRIFEDDKTVRRQRVVESKPSTRSILVTRISQFLWLVLTIIITVLTLRFVFLIIGANQGNAFVNFILRVTDVLVAPFSTILASPTLSGNSVFDIGAIVAIMIYTLVGWAIIYLFQLIFSDVGGARRVSEVEEYDMS